MNEKFNVGDIVLSVAGHDADRFYIIVSMEGIYAHICNGKLHKIEKPKKKKIKHLRNTGCTYEKLTGVQFEKSKITNPALKRAIVAYKSSLSASSAEKGYTSSR